jgi:allophanate hydrolase
VGLLLTPTAGTLFSVAQVEADPIRLNSALGYYTNYMNLLDLAGVAVPGGFRDDGLPFGVTLVARSGRERALLTVAADLHRALDAPLGATAWRLPNIATQLAPPAPVGGLIRIAVCGAHMQGLSLNHQLLERNATLLERTRTAGCYRMYALPGAPARPGLVRVSGGGAPLEVEVWALPAEQVGGFLSKVPSPLSLGSVELESGDLVTGFLCETYAAEQAPDITRFGGWRAYLKSP